MAKILWADDDQNLVKTFSVLLKPMKPTWPKIVYASDGKEALEKLKQEFFDLVILDLMMPPDKWGGLWFLEEVKKVGIRIPILILSVEGTQGETIKALRLGARDYVMKSVVDQELLSQVTKILGDIPAEVENNVVLSFPTPLALPYKRYQNTTNPTSRLKRLMEFYEVALKISCFVGLGEMQVSEYESEIPQSLSQSILQNPSFGTWNQFRNRISNDLPRSSAFYQLHGAFDDNSISAIIKTRNDISHVAEPSERVAIEHLEVFEKDLQSFLFKIWQRLNFQIVIPKIMSFDGKSFTVEGNSAIGESVAFPSFSGKSDIPLVKGQSYIFQNTNGGRQWLSIHPLMVLEQSRDPTAWDIFLYDGVKTVAKSKEFTGKEPIRYIHLWAGTRDVTMTSFQPVLEDLPGWASVF